MQTKWLLMGIGLALLAAAAGRGAEKQPGTGPWDLRALKKAPKHEVAATEQVREGDRMVTLTSLYYEGEPWMGKPTRVFAYYARPADLPEKKLPAMVLLHGGGGTAFPQWARLWAARGYAALAMDFAGCGPERKRLPDGGPDQDHEAKFQRLKDGVKNAWSYHAVASAIRGTSLLLSFPEVDRNRIGVTGISWGGYLTCIVMSLDDRLKAAVPVYGCGFLHENSAWVPILKSLPEDERRTWIENFDPSSYLARCKVPTLWVNGTNDRAYPLDSYQKSYRLVKGPRVLRVTVNMPHGHEAGWAPDEIAVFTDSIFRRKGLAPELAIVGPPMVSGERALAAYASSSAILRSKIHWTTDLAKPWEEREWKTANAKVLGLDAIAAELPKERPLVLFFTVEDNHGAITSGEHREAP